MRRLPLVLLLLALAACGTTSSAPGAPVVLATPEAQDDVGCAGEPVPARRGAVTLLAEDGTAAWTRELPPADSQAAPLLVGGTVVVGDWQGLAALDAATGEPRWQVEVAPPVYGLWHEDGRVVAVGAQVGDDGEAVGVDVATGEVRWRTALPPGGLLGDQQLTGDGGLAWSGPHDDARTSVLDLASGELRWTSAARGQQQVATGGGLVLRAEGRTVVAYDARTGDVRWRSADVGEEAHPQVVGDLVVLDQAAVGPALDGAVRALRLSDGSPAWTLQDEAPLGVAGHGDGTLVLHRTEGGAGLVVADAATGEVRWRAPGVLPELPVLVTGGTVVSAEGGYPAQPEAALVARDAQDGTVRWRVPRTTSVASVAVPRPGQVLLVEPGERLSSAVTHDLATGAVVGRAEVLGPDRLGPGPVVQGQDPHYACTG